MVRTSILLAVAGLMGCGTATQPECAFQIPGFGGYAVKMTIKTPTAGCPASIGDTWYMDGYQNATIWIFNSGSDDTVSTPRPPDDPAFGRGTFKSTFPDSSGTCSMATVTPFVVRSTTPNSAPSGTYTVTNLNALGGAVYALQQFEADVTFTGGTCTGGVYAAQGMAPPFQCTSNADCDPAAQPPNAVNPKFNQGCVTDPWTVQAILGQNKANENYDLFFNQGEPIAPANVTQPDPGTGFCFLKEAYPSLGSFSN
jgi:hypothetical protein